ncbi:hypothetical protein PsAD5_02907 [Pseudovibrio sp. Ad5]|uniref:hypothetical protein n=1 Tax=Pseudovibrio sp. Ad5 TaxID=989436 RepID=UPI0007AE4A63|nr:hypothetical protein [Pseudovibrio sp. Ad5]KZK95143.1 hypothetical protein PsAD5_02907 [Pseudovibrio sp. Ad5]
MPSIVAATIVAAVGITGTAAAIATAVIATAITVGASYLLNTLLAPKPPRSKPQDIQANIRNEAIERRRVHGGAKMGSATVFAGSNGDYRYFVHYICEGPIRFDKFFLDEEEFTLNSEGLVTKGRLKDKIQLLTMDGTQGPNERYHQVINSFPELEEDGPFRHLGCAMVLMRLKQVSYESTSKVYPAGVPKLEVLVTRLDVYNPRDGQRKKTDNPGLCALDELSSIEGVAPDNHEVFDLESFKMFADYCDEPVPLKAGSTEKRWRTRGVVTMGQDYADRIGQILECCNGEIFQNGRGQWAIRKKISSHPSFVIDEVQGDLFGLSIEGGRKDLGKYNTVKISYTNEEHQEDEASWASAAALADDGRELVANRQMYLIPSATQAMRVAKMEFYGGNPVLSGEFRTGMQALQLLSSNTYELKTELGLAGVAVSEKPFEYDDDTGLNRVEFKVISQNATIWNPDEDEQYTPVTILDVPRGASDIPLDIVATVRDTGGLRSIDIVWSASDGSEIPERYTHDVDISFDVGETWILVKDDTQERVATYSPAPAGSEAIVRVRNFVPSVQFDYQFLNGVEVPNVSAPEAPGNFSAIEGEGVVDLSWTNANSANHSGVRIYRATVDDFAQALVIREDFSASGLDRTYTDIVVAGKYYYWATGFYQNGSAVAESGEVAASENPVSVT